MSQEILDKLRDFVRLESESRELLKPPYRSYREMVKELLGSVKLGGAVENAVVETYLSTVKSLVVSMMKTRIMKLLDFAFSGNIPRENLMLEETRLLSVIEDIERYVSPMRQLKAPSNIAIARFLSSYISIKTTKGNLIVEPALGDLVVLSKDDAIELATKLRIVKVYGIREHSRQATSQ